MAMKHAVAQTQEWSGTLYRSAPPKWSAGRDMLAGVGSMKSGARFNAAATFPAVYGSTTPELAMIEWLPHGHNVIAFPDHVRPPSLLKMLRGTSR